MEKLELTELQLRDVRAAIFLAITWPEKYRIDQKVHMEGMIFEMCLVEIKTQRHLTPWITIQVLNQEV
jgi:hypothetical protein